MKYRPLGTTGLNVSILGFGAAAFGPAFGNVTQQQANAAVQRAIDLGINFFDVSPFYGLTKAETMLGHALKALNVPRSAYIVSTKVGRYGDNDFDFSAERVTAEFARSLERLQLDYVDVAHCHDIEYTDLDQIVLETVPALRRLQRDGKIRFVGVSGYPLKIFRHVLDRTPLDVVLTYNHYHLANDQLLGLIPYLKEKGVGVMSASPLVHGILSDRGTVFTEHPAPPHYREVCRQAAALTRERGVDLAQLAMQFALSNDDIATTFVGISSVEELERNVAWLEQPLHVDLLREVSDVLKPIHNVNWRCGRPENNDALQASPAEQLPLISQDHRRRYTTELRLSHGVLSHFFSMAIWNVPSLNLYCIHY
eukprot:TRINITY_DN28080_c0_g1_i1.p1 TRINITY_DN28080_c0_g1~~TRINITY_DN28080_c0_g1_i1.p1  ORF type:complete len:367 (-),score=90.30 TRINITY_DN28080_c0_g1_i1:66-1166(-)